MADHASKDYRDGYASGMKHDNQDPLCRDNLRKARNVQATDEYSQAVKDYWQGYMDAVNRPEGEGLEGDPVEAPEQFKQSVDHNRWTATIEPYAGNLLTVRVTRRWPNGNKRDSRVDWVPFTSIQARIVHMVNQLWEGE